MSLDDFIVNLRFFLPSKSLTRTILELNSEFLRLSEMPEGQMPKTKGKGRILGFLTRGLRVEQQQRVIAERLYRYLAAVARKSNELDEIVYVWDCIPHGMAVHLGFPAYTDIQARTDVGIRAIGALKELT